MLNQSVFTCKTNMDILRQLLNKNRRNDRNAQDVSETLQLDVFFKPAPLEKGKRIG